jgi:hypothetical protein
MRVEELPHSSVLSPLVSRVAVSRKPSARSRGPMPLTRFKTEIERCLGFLRVYLAGRPPNPVVLTADEKSPNPQPSRIVGLVRVVRLRPSSRGAAAGYLR